MKSKHPGFSILWAAMALVVTAMGQDPDFHAYYTKLAFKHPQDTDLLGRIPVSAARSFAGKQSDHPDLLPRQAKASTVRWGRYPDLIVNFAKARQLVFSRATGYLPYLRTELGRFPLRALAPARPDPMCLSSWVSLVRSSPGEIVVHWRHVPDPSRVVMTETIHENLLHQPHR